MRKKYAMISIGFISLFVFVFLLTYNLKNKKDNEILLSKEEILTEKVNAEEDKISFDAEVLVTETFDECMHYEEYNIDLDDSLINLNEEEIRKHFEEKGYDLRNFTSKKVELLKSKEGICDNHYIIKCDNDSEVFLNVYKKDEEGNLNFYKQTDIAKEFLTDMDRELFESGIEGLGLENIEKVLEDYE